MSERLNRIFNLSKKTGDTIVVHDPTAAHDLVVLPFGHYEDLISSSGHNSGDYDEYLLEELSERELIDKINRDIAIWRSYQELNQRERQAALLEDQLADDPLPDPFEEDFSHRSDWHKVSDLFQERYKKSVQEESQEEEQAEEDSGEPIHTYTPVHDESTQVYSKTSFFERVHEPHGVPMHTENTQEVFEEESALDSEDPPVFFEEPSV